MASASKSTASSKKSSPSTETTAATFTAATAPATESAAVATVTTKAPSAQPAVASVTQPTATVAPAAATTAVALTVQSAASVAPAAAAAATLSVAAAAAPAPAPVSLFDWLTSFALQFQAMFSNATPTVSFKPGENTLQGDGTIVGKVYGFDANGDPLIYSASKPANGTVVVDAAGNFVYTPNPTPTSVDTTDQFTVTVTEANAASHFHGLMGLFSPGYGSSASTSVTVNSPATAPAQTSNKPSPQMSSVPAAGDTTAALQAIFDQLKAGDTLTLANRTYEHSGVLKIRVSGVTINGNGATLQAANDATSSVQILADNVSVSNLNLTAALTGDRYFALEQHKLVIAGRGDTVTNVSIKGSAGAGVFVNGASYFTLNQVRVSNTRADAIHMTNGANNGTVNNAVVTAAGDDGISVVSYEGDGGRIVHDIVVNSPVINGTTWGRGLSVVGGQNISYRNITVSNTNAAGVYIASEGSPYFTTSVNHVEVVGGTITGANYNGGVVHGAVLVYSGNAKQTINDVTLSGLTITSTAPTAQRNVAIVVDAGTVSNLKFTNIALKKTTLAPLIRSSNVPATAYTASGWTLDGKPISV